MYVASGPEKGVGDTWQVPAWLEGVFGDSGAMPPYGWASSTRRRRSDARGLSQTQLSSALPESSTREKPVRRKGEERETTLLSDHGKQSSTRRTRTERPS